MDPLKIILGLPPILSQSIISLLTIKNRLLFDTSCLYLSNHNEATEIEPQLLRNIFVFLLTHLHESLEKNCFESCHRELDNDASIVLPNHE